jgi:hypothetical protein
MGVTEVKEFTRAIRALWEEVRKERRARRKAISSADLVQSAALLKDISQKLEALALQAAEVEATRPAPAKDKTDTAAAKPTPKPRRKSKKPIAGKSSKKAKKKRAE